MVNFPWVLEIDTSDAEIDAGSDYWSGSDSRIITPDVILTSNKWKTVLIAQWDNE